MSFIANRLRAVLFVLWAAPLAAQQTPPSLGSSAAPSYSADSVVNGATQTVEALAPNTIATLYGANLAFATQAVAPSDVVGGLLPTSLGNVGVWMNGLPCSLFLVSPTQINFLVPSQLTPGTVSLVVARQSFAGPTISVQLNATSPGLFLWNKNLAVAVHLNGQVVSVESPASAGEIVVLYAAGLGRTTPDAIPGQLAKVAAPITSSSNLAVLFDQLPAPPGTILYAGLAPGYAGLYQINLKIPAGVGHNPQLQLVTGALISPAAVILPVQ